MSKNESSPAKTASPFASLLAEIESYPPKEAENHIQGWRSRMDEIWPAETSNEKYWELLVERLPVCEEAPECDFGEAFASLICVTPQNYRSVDAFICTSAYLRLKQYWWTNDKAWVSYRFVIGCVNLAALSNTFAFDVSPDALMSTLQDQLAQYWGVLVRVALHSLDVFAKNKDRYRLADVIDLKTSKGRVVRSELSSILKDNLDALDNERVFEVISFITGFSREEVLRHLIPLLVKEKDTREKAKAFWTEDVSISRDFAHLLEQAEREAERAELLRTWTHHLVPDDAFDFCWDILFWESAANHFGASYEDRFTTLRDLLLHIPMRQMFHQFHRHGDHKRWREGENWRHWFVDLFKAVGSLVERQRWDRTGGDVWIRQTEAVELLTKEPSHLRSVVLGMLNKGKEHRDVLDPIILGLTPEPTIELLRRYAESHSGSEDDYFHAKRLIAHLKGTIPADPTVRGGSGLLGAVETLINASRTKLRDPRNQTWLGDAGVESLWYGAIQNAVNEFTECFRKDFGQNEHELVFFLAKKMAAHLNNTNRTVSEWLQKNTALPLFINASVRRIPTRSKKGHIQEGGKKGVQADLGFVMICDVPGVMKAKRVTLVQCKKLKQEDRTKRWAAGFPCSVTQLERLLNISRQSHYMFFIHPDLGCPSMMLPALTVEESCSAGKSPSVPLPVVRNGGMAIPDFVLHGVVGLWAGDRNEDLITKCQECAESGEGPDVMIEIRVSSKGETNE